MDLRKKFFDGDIAIDLSVGDINDISIFVDMLTAHRRKNGTNDKSIQMQQIQHLAMHQESVKEASLLSSNTSNVMKFLYMIHDNMDVTLEIKTLQELLDLEEKLDKEIDIIPLSDVAKEWYETRKSLLGDKEIVGLIEDKYAEREKIEFELVKPVEIEKRLDEYVVGQDQAKKILAIAAYNHSKMIQNNKSENPDPIIDKSNILIIGPSGSGKTYIIEILSKILKRPFVKVTASGLTASGYAGRSVDSILAQLWTQCDGNRELAENAIVFIDEIDKIATTNASSNISGKDIGGEVVQQELLKVVEGPEVEFQLGLSSEIINTSNILFIVGGAFNGISEEKKTIRPDDIIEYGFIKEFVGRFPIIVKFNRLTIDELRRILTEPKNAITKQYQKLVEMDGNKLEFTERYLQHVAMKAYSLNTGARALRTILENDLLEILYESSKASLGRTFTMDITNTSEGLFDIELDLEEDDNSDNSSGQTFLI